MGRGEPGGVAAVRLPEELLTGLTDHALVPLAEMGLRHTFLNASDAFHDMVQG